MAINQGFTFTLYCVLLCWFVTLQKYLLISNFLKFNFFTYLHYITESHRIQFPFSLHTVIGQTVRYYTDVYSITGHYYCNAIGGLQSCSFKITTMSNKLEDTFLVFFCLLWTDLHFLKGCWIQKLKQFLFNFIFLFTSIIRSTIVSHCSGRLVWCTVSHKEQLALRDLFQLTDIFHV